MPEYTGDNRRKRTWGFWFLVVAFPATAVASYTAAPNPVEPDPIVIPVYTQELAELAVQNAGLAEQNALLLARAPEVREVVVYRDTGRTLPPIIDSIPYPVLEIVRDSFPYPVPGEVRIVQIPAVKQGSPWPTNIGFTLAGGIAGALVRSAFDARCQDVFLDVEVIIEEHDGR